MELVVLGLSHRTAPVEVRERLAAAPSEIEEKVRGLVELPGLSEAALLSTCNRVEVYAVAPDGSAALLQIREHLRRQTAADLDHHLYERIGTAAIHHLFRVAASLDSLVVGESQILGQVKDAFDAALRAGSVGPVLGFVFPRAFRVAKRVRRDTGITRHPTSVSSVAVQIARQIWSGFAGRRVLLIGAGEMADLAARALHAQGAVVAVTNRTAARAQELADRLGFEVEPFSELARALERSDIVITSTGSRQPLLGPDLLEGVQRARRNRPLVLIDIAVPRDVDPAVDALEGIYRWDIDNLQAAAAQNLEGRQKEADRAEALIEDELRRCLAAERGRSVGPTISALRARVLGVARTEVERTLGDLPDLDDRTRRTIRALADAIAAKLLHAPQVALKKGAEGEGEDLVAAAHALFDLAPVEPVSQMDDDTDTEDDSESEDDSDSEGGRAGPEEKKILP